MSRTKCYMREYFSQWGLHTGWCSIKKKDRSTMSSKCRGFHGNEGVTGMIREDKEKRNQILII